MNRRSWSGMLLCSLAVISCGGNPAPARVAAPGIPTAPQQSRPSESMTNASCIGYGGAGSSCPASAPSPARRDSAARAFANGLMPLASGGIKQFAADHPQWDGRGVLIAILDSGIDPGIPGLGTTSDGAPKLLDLRDFSGEGRIRLQRATRHGDTLVVGSHRVLGASRVLSVAGDGELWGGTLAELGLGKPPAADINGNKVVGDTLMIVAARTTSGWALFTDTDGNGTVADERPVHDYLVAHETFGWHQRAEAPPLFLAANFTESAGTPSLDLFFDTSSHGSHVSGIAAGRNIYGVAGFDGVAPGAKLIGLKIADDAHGAVSVTGSMVRALDYAIGFAKERAMPLVVNLSFGVGNEIEGTARIDAMIDSILGAHPDVVMTIAAGNDGPGLSSLGFPGSSSRTITVGATLPSVFQGADPLHPMAEIVAPFSSRGGEIAGPDIVVPGAAYSTVPVYAIGDEIENGTSMAAPYAAGMAARLMSAARATGRPVNARTIRHALRMGAQALARGSAVDQGAGLPDLGRAWAWLSASHDLAVIAVDVGQVANSGAVLLTANPAGTAQKALGARVTLRRLDSAASLTVRLASDAAWLQLPETVTLTGGRGEFTVGVRSDAIAAAGVLHAAIRVEGADETAGALAVIPVTVRVPMAVTSAGASVAIHEEPGGVARVFVPADSGRGMQIEIETVGPNDRLAVALHEPGGMPFRDDRTIVAGFGSGAGLFDLDARDVAAGVYEVDVEATGFAPANARVTVRQSPVRLGATFVRDTLHITSRSLVTGTISLRVRAGLIGAERRVVAAGNDDKPMRLAIPVPSWASRVVVDSRMPREAWARFTDFGVSFLDRHDRQFDSHPINYAFSRAAVQLPDSMVGDTLILLLSPGYADPADHGPWSIELNVRYYVDTPYSLDAGGSAVKPIAGGAVREDRFVPGAFPIAFPPEFLPVVTIVALEGSDHIWTREIVLTGPPR